MDYRKIIINSIRRYFAPLTGAYNGYRTEWKKYISCMSEKG